MGLVFVRNDLQHKLPQTTSQTQGQTLVKAGLELMSLSFQRPFRHPDQLVEGRLVKGLGGEAVALGGPGRKQHGLLLAIPTHLGSPALTILIADNGYRPPVFGPLPSITQGSRLRIGAP